MYYTWVWVPESCHWLLSAYGSDRKQCEQSLRKSGLTGVVNQIAGQDIGDTFPPESFSFSRSLIFRLQSGQPCGLYTLSQTQRAIVDALLEHRYKIDPAWHVIYSGDRRTVWLERSAR